MRIPTLAVLSICCLCSIGQAQIKLTCEAVTNIPPALRSEGLTELTGDIVINCGGGTPTPAGASVPTTNLTLFLNTTATSRLLGNNGASEALLLIDEPSPANQAAGTSTLIGNGTGLNVYTTSNVYQGSARGSNGLEFIGVPIDPPGTQGTRIFRITNVRANATLVFDTPSSKNQITGFIQSGNPALNTGSLVLGQVQPSFSFQVPFTGSPQQCLNNGTSLQGASYLRYTELFPTAFKTRVTATSGGSPAPQNTPGFIYNTESGFYNPAPGSSLGPLLCKLGGLT